MRIVPMEPVGARIEQLPVQRAGPLEIACLRAVLAEHGVLVLAGQEAGDEDFVAFLRQFGDLAFTAGETPVPGRPELNLITNVGRSVAPRSTFHVDTSYVSAPPAYTGLRAVRIPERGGETLFSNQVRALCDLPASLRARIDGRSLTHVVTGLDLGPDDERSAVHPLVRPHPLTGRRSLYLTTPARCQGVSGLNPADSAELVGMLYDWSTREENLLRHSWSPGDIVIWDNAVVMHRADHAGVAGDRVMHRGMVAGTGPGVERPGRSGG